MKLTVEERFLGRLYAEGDCIVARGATSASGHVAFSYVPYKKGVAHRYAWERVNGPIPKDMCVCHTCDNPACVRIEHLFLGTHADNNADKCAKKRHSAGERHGRSKLTEDDVREIRKMKKSGASCAVLSKRFGVHHSNIYYIVNRVTWPDVSDN